jgi:hypothetical protein
MVNMQKRHNVYGYTVIEYMKRSMNNMQDDVWGIWGIIAAGKHGFCFRDQELRDFVELNVKTLIEVGGVVLNSAQDRWRCYQHATHYGTDPDEIARNVVAEWVAQGEPEILGYQGIAFATPDFIDSEDNRRETPRDD